MKEMIEFYLHYYPEVLKHNVTEMVTKKNAVARSSDDLSNPLRIYSLVFLAACRFLMKGHSKIT